MVPRSGSPAGVSAVTSVAMGQGHRPTADHMLSLRPRLHLGVGGAKSAEPFQLPRGGHCEPAESVQRGAGFASSSE
jgi:hypothetical protein